MLMLQEILKRAGGQHGDRGLHTIQAAKESLQREEGRDSQLPCLSTPRHLPA